MGFERVTAIIQGTKNLTDFSGTISNYETDIFRPIFDELEKLSGKKYASTLTGLDGAPSERSTRQPTRLIRKRSTSPFVSSPITSARLASRLPTESFHQTKDAVMSCAGFLRRAVRYGRTLGFHEPFFFKLVDVVAKTMGDVFPEIRAKQKKVKETIRREEEAFNKTLG